MFHVRYYDRKRIQSTLILSWCAHREESPDVCTEHARELFRDRVKRARDLERCGGRIDGLHRVRSVWANCNHSECVDRYPHAIRAREDNDHCSVPL